MTTRQRDALSAHTYLEPLATEADLNRLLHTSARLAGLARTTDEPTSFVRALNELAEIDSFATLAAIESLGSLRTDEATASLVGFLEDPDPVVRRHATWRLGSRRPIRSTYGLLIRQLLVGGIDTMHAHRTLRRWASVDPASITTTIAGSLAISVDSADRARLVDLLGVVGRSTADELLLRIASDPYETLGARISAVSALGDRAPSDASRVLRSLATLDDEVGTAAVLALEDLGRDSTIIRDSPSNGLRVAQFTLIGSLDGQLSQGGQGETGGVASLLVSLGDALARRDDVAHVTTISRGSLTDVLANQILPDHHKQSYGSISIGDSVRPALSAQQAWEHLPEIERGLRRVLRNRDTFDVLHLRMADVGTLAGSFVAKSLGVATCFSLAPDPHNVIESLQARGELNRKNFAKQSENSNLWFRARLIERLSREADLVAQFPRAKQFAAFGDIHLSDGREPPRAAVIAEGIDVGLIRRSESAIASLGSDQPLPTILANLVAAIPDDRRHLPVVLSVGRLNPVKGMDRVAAAWAGNESLYSTCNLVMVGGSLDEPSPSEQEVIASIRTAVPDDHPARSGFVMLGGRPHSDIALILVAASTGLDGRLPGGGVYVDGALKEEFGLSLLEALCAGLVVVAPNAGGPPTYVDQRSNGILVDADADLGDAIIEAFQLVDTPGRAAHAKSLVADRYSIETMASGLIDLYQQTPILL